MNRDGIPDVLKQPQVGYGTPVQYGAPVSYESTKAVYVVVSCRAMTASDTHPRVRIPVAFRSR